MKINLFEKVCLNFLGLTGIGLPIFAGLSLGLGTPPTISAILAAVIGASFGNWAWVSLEHETRQEVPHPKTQKGPASTS